MISYQVFPLPVTEVYIPGSRFMHILYVCTYVAYVTRHFGCVGLLQVKLQDYIAKPTLVWPELYLLLYKSSKMGLGGVRCSERD